MPRNPTSHVRGVSVAVLVLVTVAILLVISSCSSRAEASPSGDPTTTKLAVEVKWLRREVFRLREEVERLDRITFATRCVLRIWEDSSSRLLDAERVSRGCRTFIAQYVGSGLAKADLR